MDINKVAFAVALSEINIELSKKQLKGKKNYFCKTDLKTVWHRQKGMCALCRLPLDSVARKNNSVQYMLYTPLELGGVIEVDNLIAACPRCKKEYHPKMRPAERVEGFNSVADLIVCLAQAAAEPNTSPCKIRILKTELNSALADMIHTLHYTPTDKIKERAQIRKRIKVGDNTVADIIEDIANGGDRTEDLVDTLETASVTKYKIIQ